MTLPSQVDIFYMHAPNDSVPLSSTLAGVNEAYMKGYFSRLGLSNYRVEDVEVVYNQCYENGYVLPTVYQGNYPAAADRGLYLLPQNLVFCNSDLDKSTTIWARKPSKQWAIYLGSPPWY